MRYYEFKGQYYSLIKAKKRSIAEQLYLETIKNVHSCFKQDPYTIEEISEESAIEKYIRENLNKGFELHVHQVSHVINSKENFVLFVNLS